MQSLVDKAVEIYGRLDCAHNNAGSEREYTFPELKHTEEIWNRTIDVNLKGVWLWMKYEVPEMLKHGGGAIGNTSSIAGLVAVVGQPVYIASKHGVIGLMRATALEHAQRGHPGQCGVSGLYRDAADGANLRAAS